MEIGNEALLTGPGANGPAVGSGASYSESAQFGRLNEAPVMATATATAAAATRAMGEASGVGEDCGMRRGSAGERDSARIGCRSGMHRSSNADVERAVGPARRIASASPRLLLRAPNVSIRAGLLACWRVYCSGLSAARRRRPRRAYRRLRSPDDRTPFALTTSISAQPAALGSRAPLQLNALYQSPPGASLNGKARRGPPIATPLSPLDTDCPHQPRVSPSVQRARCISSATPKACNGPSSPPSAVRRP